MSIMAHDWKDKVVLITGAATGIGESVVRILLEEGVKYVAFLDINEEAGKSLENELNSKYGDKAKFYKSDVTNEGEFLEILNSVAQEQGAVDVVINNAALMNDSLDVYKKAIELNVTALITNTLKAIELMGKHNGGKGGTVINISSVAALTQSYVMPIYFATKSAVLQFSNCIGQPEHFTKSGVRVLTVCFGATDTSLLSEEKLGSFDEDIDSTCLNNLRKGYVLQSKDAAAQGLIDAYKKGDSGSTWLVINNLPVEDISGTVTGAYKKLSQLIYRL